MSDQGPQEPQVMRNSKAKTWSIVGAAVAGVAIVAALTVNDQRGHPEVHVGQSFTVGDVKVADGWKVSPSAEGTKSTGTVTYTGDRVAQSVWLFTLKFWNGDGEIKDASINCHSEGTLQPGASGSFECGPTDLHQFTYDRITAEKY